MAAGGEAMSDTVRIKIKGEGGNPCTWTVTDQDGRPLPVTRLDLSMAMNHPPSFRLRIEMLDVEIDADTLAEVVKICPACRKALEGPKA